jgi:PhzF family phenazine biosynthesis protein
MGRAYCVVDAFTSERFAGNPAAVVLDATGMNDDQMQAVAAEFNLSETTFVLPPETPDADLRFRWFTPTVEVSMCGHATIAGVHALDESGRLPPKSIPNSGIRIETRSGLVDAMIERVRTSGSGRIVWLELPSPKLSRIALSPSELASALGLPKDALRTELPVMKTQDGDVILFVQDFLALNDARPDFALLEKVSRRSRLRGWCVATLNTLTPSIHVQSRFFAPAVGVDEDPVTGSVHGPLAMYLVKHGLAPLQHGAAGLTCVQAKAGGRAGLVRALVRPREDKSYSVKIGGQAVTTMRGTLVET